MCGFTGFLTLDGAARLASPTQAARTMADRLAHRGPDDAGVWTDDAAGVALGHRRLSIVDLSPEGHQPMHSADGRYVVAFNGEIYNFPALRRELEGRGHRFRGHSDTEVLLAAVVQWGVRPAVERFVGMFAFALWDRQTRTLSLCRDRLGEKPLYYGWVADTFLFGSELKALSAHPRWQGEVSREALALFLRYNYVPAPHSIYSGIAKLTPGTILTLRAGAGRARPAPEPYWSAAEVTRRGLEDPFRGSEAEAEAQLDALLREAVGAQMVADVPLGAFLSGGVDSSAIVALMQAQSARPVQTFTIGFHEGSHNEAVHAKAVARHLGTDHTELYVTARESMDVIPRLPALYDEPFADSSQIPTFLVSQLARRRVTVSLSGDGADELFGGYNRYFLGRSAWDRVRRIPRAPRAALGQLLHAIPRAAFEGPRGGIGALVPARWRPAHLADQVRKLGTLLQAGHPGAVYLNLVSCWQDPAEVVLGVREPASLATAPDGGFAPADFTDRMMYLDVVGYLPDDILAKVDRAAMGVSLETRVPFLDHRVVDFAWRLPLAMKIRGGQGKWLLRQVLHRYVPRELIERPKMGFCVPVAAWLRGPLRDWAESVLDEQALRRDGYLDPAPIRRKWREHVSGSHNWEYPLWGVLTFQSWLDAARRADAAAAA